MAQTTFSGPVQSLNGFLDANGNQVATDAAAVDAIKNKPEIAALVSPTADYASLAAATAAIKSIIDALKA